jgi:hypothetical protein
MAYLNSQSVFAECSSSQQLMAFYNGIVDDPNGTDKAWVATSMAIRLAQMVSTLRVVVVPSLNHFAGRAS